MCLWNVSVERVFARFSVCRLSHVSVQCVSVQCVSVVEILYSKETEEDYVEAAYPRSKLAAKSPNMSQGDMANVRPDGKDEYVKDT